MQIRPRRGRTGQISRCRARGGMPEHKQRRAEQPSGRRREAMTKMRLSHTVSSGSSRKQMGRGPVAWKPCPSARNEHAFRIQAPHGRPRHPSTSQKLFGMQSGSVPHFWGIRDKVAPTQNTVLWALATRTSSSGTYCWYVGRDTKTKRRRSPGFARRASAGGLRQTIPTQSLQNLLPSTPPMQAVVKRFSNLLLFWSSMPSQQLSELVLLIYLLSGVG